MPNSRTRFLRAAALSCLLAGAGVRAAGPLPTSEAVLRQELLEARWPADIVRVGERYIAAYPLGPGAAAAKAELERARNTKRLLERSNIRLYRGDFVAAGAPPAVQEDVRKAALADHEAAVRMAHVHRDAPGGIEGNLSHYIGWLQYSAALGDAPGSYELALYFRKTDQPALASPFEARAEELGFKPPPALDNIRK